MGMGVEGRGEKGRRGGREKVEESCEESERSDVAVAAEGEREGGRRGGRRWKIGMWMGFEEEVSLSPSPPPSPSTSHFPHLHLSLPTSHFSLLTPSNIQTFKHSSSRLSPQKTKKNKDRITNLTTFCSEKVLIFFLSLAMLSWIDSI